MTFDLSAKINELDGKEGTRTIADVLAEFLGTETKGNTVKLCYWYGHLLNNTSLDLDEPDQKAITELIEGSERLYVFIKAQLLSALKKT